ncbi:MAG: heme o synthase [Armatimonadota bacterium]|nr:heme o synthase [Armatimonadota bacterium]MDR7518513.1 heme o synthase [Armatimonadota bacterium]MDR7550441.1 heme o synthase [Armatimonadota bacterium]
MTISRGSNARSAVPASIRRLSLLASASTGLLLVAGATVSATGAGLACPDWPLCRGRLIPPLDRLVLIEYGHRLLASAVGVMVLALVVMTWRHLGSYPRLRRLAAVLVGLLALQVGLGGATVLSALVPLVVSAHLLVAMSFLALLVAYTARVRWEIDPDLEMAAPPRGLRTVARLALAAAFLQAALGGVVSAFGAGLACPDVPLCQGSLLPPAEPRAILHTAHRLAALVVVLLVAAVAARARESPDRATRTAVAVAVGLVIVQVGLGALNVWTRLAVPIRVAHLGGGAALLATLVALVVRVGLTAQVGRAEPGTAGSPAGLRPAVADYIALMKPRIIALLLLTTLTAMVVAAGGWVGWALAVATLLGGTLAAGAANAINCYWDRDVDAIMHRTRGRPIPQRRIAPAQALRFGAALAVASVLVLGLAVNWLSAALAGLGIAYYVGIYTIWLKRTTPQNIVIGGAAGAIPPLVGWAAVTNQVGIPAMVLFAIVFLWTPPHFWALALNRAEDYRAARIPMLPVVRGTTATVRQMVIYTVALVAATLLLAGVGGLGPIYTVSAVALAVPLVVLVLRLARQVTPDAAWALFEYSILYLGLLFASMAVDRLLA